MSGAVHTDPVPVDGVTRISLAVEAVRSINQAESDVLVESSKQRLKHGDVLHDTHRRALMCAADANLSAAMMLLDGEEEEDARAVGFQYLLPSSLEPASLGSARDCLVRAAALLIAEIDRLDRAAAKGNGQ